MFVMEWFEYHIVSIYSGWKGVKELITTVVAGQLISILTTNLFINTIEDTNVVGKFSWNKLF
jgi:hypothetical protein